MTEKNDTIKNLVTGARFTAMYNEATVNSLRAFKRGFKFATPQGVTFERHMITRLEGMRALVNALRNAQGIDLPINLEAAMLREGSDSLRSTYNHHTRTITMVGKLSVITLLHEFAHALLGKREDFAQDWSINLFRIIYPRAFEGLASPYPRAFEGLDSPCGHVLMKGNDLRTIEAPVRTVAVDLTPLPLIDAECESA